MQTATNGNFVVTINQSGRKIIVNVKNQTGGNCSVLVWNTVLDHPYAHGFALKQNTGLIPYTGPVYKRAFIENISTIEFAPGEEKTFEYETLEVLNEFKLEDLQRNETVYIGIKSKSFLIYDVETSLKKEVETFYEVNLVSNDLLLDSQFIADGLKKKESERFEDLNLSVSDNSIPPLCVFGHNDGYIELGPTVSHVLGFPLTSNLTAAKKNIVRQVARELYELMVHVYKPVKNDALYKKWFGTFSVQNQNKVNATMRSVRPGACPSYIIFDGAGTTRCKPDTYAYIIYTREYNEHPRQCTATQHYCHRIFLCALFWRSPLKGQNSQVGTLAHELSHGYSYTQDHVYGSAKCLDLARNNAAMAIENADNIEYYLEALM